MDPWRTLEDERLRFADLLDGLTPEQWETRSLCGGWTVAEVATHMMAGTHRLAVGLRSRRWSRRAPTSTGPTR